MAQILRYFYFFVFKYKYHFALLILTLVVAVILENSAPYILKLIVDAATKGELAGIGRLLLIYVGTRIAFSLVDALSYTLGDAVMIPASRDARISVFKKIQDLDFAYHVNKNTGSLISAFKRGDGAFYTLFMNLHQEVLRTVMSLIVVLIFLSGININILLMMLGMAIVNGVAMIWLIKLNVQKRKNFNDAEDRISGIITDNLINYETVKFFAQEKGEAKRLKRSFVPWTKCFWGYANSFRVTDVTIGLISSVGMFFILRLALKMLTSNQIGIGDFVMISGFLMGFYYRFFGLFFQMRNIVKSFADLQRYLEILGNEVVVKDPDKPLYLGEKLEGKIDFVDVGFKYPGNRKKVLDKINLQIKPGETVAFAGRSGAGKTTLIKLLLRFYDLTKGKILIDGVDITKLEKSHLRSFIGVVPQEPVLFNNSIEFNIGYGKEGVNLKEIRAAARMANLDDFIMGLPDKYQTEVGERGIKLSGGQKQRLAIARAMLIDPKILVFDEATSNLDSESEEMVQQALWNTAKNRTVLIIAHRFSTIRRADKIVVLDGGQIAEVGSHQKLIGKRSGVYKKLWELQSKGKLEKDESGLVAVEAIVA